MAPQLCSSVWLEEEKVGNNGDLQLIVCLRWTLFDGATLHGRKSSDFVWVDDEWDKITEAAGLACPVCPERGFKEINPCLIHKYQRQPCALLYFFLIIILSVLLHFDCSNANPNTLNNQKVFLFIHHFIIRLSNHGCRKYAKSRRRCLSSLDLLRQNNFPSPKVQPWVNKKVFEISSFSLRFSVWTPRRWSSI